jgi:hypothetical protein
MKRLAASADRSITARARASLAYGISRSELDLFGGVGEDGYGGDS